MLPKINKKKKEKLKPQNYINHWLSISPSLYLIIYEVRWLLGWWWWWWCLVGWLVGCWMITQIAPFNWGSNCCRTSVLVNTQLSTVLFAVTSLFIRFTCFFLFQYDVVPFNSLFILFWCCFCLCFTTATTINHSLLCFVFLYPKTNNSFLVPSLFRLKGEQFYPSSFVVHKANTNSFPFPLYSTKFLLSIIVWCLSVCYVAICSFLSLSPCCCCLFFFRHHSIKLSSI